MPKEEKEQDDEESEKEKGKTDTESKEKIIPSPSGFGVNRIETSELEINFEEIKRIIDEERNKLAKMIDEVSTSSTSSLVTVEQINEIIETLELNIPKDTGFRLEILSQRLNNELREIRDKIKPLEEIVEKFADFINMPQRTKDAVIFYEKKFSYLDKEISVNKETLEGINKRLDDLARNQSRWIYAIIAFFFTMVIVAIFSLLLNLPPPALP